MPEREMTHNDVVISTRLSLSRNYADTPFDSGMSDEDAERNIERVSNALSEAGQRQAFSCVRLSDMSQSEQNWLLDRGQITRELMKKPSRGAVYIGKADPLIILLNELDHVRLSCALEGFQPERAAELCRHADGWIDGQGELAYDDQFGYLTVDPLKAGTGLSAEVRLHLYTLMVGGQIDKIIGRVSSDGMTLKPELEGKEGPCDGVYVLSASAGMGDTCEDFIEKLTKTALSVSATERDIRRKIVNEEPLFARDRIARALAIIEAAVIINEREMRMRCSELRCGIRDGLLDVPYAAVDRMMLSLTNAALDLRTGAMLSEIRRNEMRATEFKAALQRLLSGSNAS